MFVGDSAGVLHAVRTRDGSRALDVQDGPRDQVVARRGRGAGARSGSYDGTPLRARREHRAAALEVRDRRSRARDAGRVERRRVHRRVRRELQSDQPGRRQGALPDPSGANTAASPVIDGDRAYVGTFNNEVLAFDLRARKICWRYQNPDRQFPFYSSAALADGRVIVGGRDKLVHAIDAATGKAVWTFATRARVDSSPAVAGGRVYVGSSDGRLYVLDASPDRNAGSSTPARRSRPRPPSRPGASCSDRPTACSTASGSRGAALSLPRRHEHTKNDY